MRAVAAAFAFAVFALSCSCGRTECAAPHARAASACADCEGERVVLLGACVTRQTADAYCGRGGRFVRGRCEPSPTSDDEADEAELADDAVCPRGTTRREAARASAMCVAGTRCRAGEIAEGSRCAPLFREPGVVDLGAFLRGAIGVDGGEGTADVCGPIVALAERDGDRPARLAITFSLRFPANQIADLDLRVVARDAASGERLVPSREASIESSAIALFDVLRAMGGLGARASAAAADVTVTCAMPVRAARGRVKSAHP